LSIVISFFNEEKVLPDLLSRLRAVLRKQMRVGKICRYELVFVNDRSTDGSARLLQREIEESDDVVLINMSRNFGNSECVFADVQHAGGDIVIYMNADLQDPPEIIPQLLLAQADSRSRGSLHYSLEPRRRASSEAPNHTVGLPSDQHDFGGRSSRRFRRFQIAFTARNLVQIEEKRAYMRGLVTWIIANPASTAASGPRSAS
jgi:dolichol-phosphate mannosyltransferase